MKEGRKEGREGGREGGGGRNVYYELQSEFCMMDIP